MERTTPRPQVSSSPMDDGDVEVARPLTLELAGPGKRLGIWVHRAACGGTWFQVQARDAVILTALKLTITARQPMCQRSASVAATPQAVRIFCTTAALPGRWHWQPWIQVGEEPVPSASRSLHAAIRLKFRQPVPISAGSSRTFYVYSPVGVASFQTASPQHTLGQDDALIVTSAGGHSNSEILL